MAHLISHDGHLVWTNSHLVNDAGEENLTGGTSEGSNYLTVDDLTFDGALLLLDEAWPTAVVSARGVVREASGDIWVEFDADVYERSGTVSGLDSDTIHQAEFRGYDADGDYVYNAVARFRTDPSPSGLFVPGIPTAPDVSKDCAGAALDLAMPVWDTGATTPTQQREIQRSLDGGDSWQLLATQTVAANYSDTTAPEFVNVIYRIRDGNVAGWSAWSTASTALALQSSTLALAFISPAADSNVKNKIVLKFSAIDAGGIEGKQIFVNGALVQPLPRRVSGTDENGVWLLEYDTRRAAQGAATITVVATGSDDCKARATLQLTFSNTWQGGVLYRDWLTEEASDGREITRLPLALGLGELDADPTMRFWGQAAITSDTSVPVVTEATDPAAAQTAFDAMQPFPFSQRREWPRLGFSPPGSTLFDTLTVSDPGEQIIVRVRTEPVERFIAYDTHSARIAKIRRLSDGLHYIFAQTPDKFLTFDGSTLVEAVNLETTEATAEVTDASQVGDKIYFLNNSQLIAYDIDPLTGARQRTLGLTIYRENRIVKSIEGIGDKLIAVFVNATPGDDQTLGVSVEGDQVNDLWTLDVAATLTWTQGVDLFIACGAKFYKSAAGTGAPELVREFDDTITAICLNGVGLEDGSVWGQDAEGGEWTQGVIGSGDATSAITRWMGSFEYWNFLWGNDGAASLLGQDANRSWDVERALGTFDGVDTQATGLSALDRYFKPDEETTTPPVGPGMPDVPAQTGPEVTAGEELALIGTEGGLLLILSVSQLSAAGAWLHSTIEDEQTGIISRLGE